MRKNLSGYQNKNKKKEEIGRPKVYGKDNSPRYTGQVVNGGLYDLREPTDNVERGRKNRH